MEYRRWTAARRPPLGRNLSCPGGVNLPDYDDDDSVNNNGGVLAAANINDTTTLVDELEQLRTDNFQLRLRVYNAERRVDRLSASSSVARSRDRSSGDSDDDSSSSGAEDGARAAAASAKATAEAAVRTIHDLLTVNRRLLALLAAAVSAKAVAVTDRDKRRWQKLRKCLDDCGGADAPIEEDEEPEKSDDESDTSANSETRTATVRRPRDDASDGCAADATTRLAPRPPPSPEPNARGDDDDAGGGELVRLRARCRRLERSLQQLVNTELWARNRQIGKLEQQRYVTQAQANAVAPQKEPRSSAVVPQLQPRLQAPAATKGILVKKSPPDTLPAKDGAATAAAVVITTPPPVLPDYSEVNFFYSCDEDEDDDDDDQENDSETNAGLSSTEEETTSDDDDEKEPVKLTGTTRETSGRTAVRVGTPLATSSPQIVRSQKPKRRRHRQKHGATRAAMSSSTESVSVTAGDPCSGSTTGSPAPSRRRHRGAGVHRRRRCKPRRYSTCGGDADRGSPTGCGGAGATTADAQVQCGGDGGDAEIDATSADGGGDDQMGLLRRELEARRRENCSLYDMLLRQQRGRSKAASSVRLPPEDSDRCDEDDDHDNESPEPYRRAARAVRGRIADLLPPLLSTMGGSVDDDAAPTPLRDRQNDNEQTLLLRQQQQQLLLLARLRERIVAYERQELQGGGGGGGGGAANASAADQENAVEHMDRAALVNVALPRAVDRLRRALVPLVQHKQQQKPSPIVETVVAAERESSVG